MAPWSCAHGLLGRRASECTTRHRIAEASAEEQPCLITLPSVVYPAQRPETRTVQKDGYIPFEAPTTPCPSPSSSRTR